MKLKDITEYCQSVALASKFSPSDESVWRYFARSYSKKFFTPLHLVMEMPPEEVILHVYEDQMDDVDMDENIDKLADMLYSLEDPNYESSKEEELDEFIEEAEKEEKNRVKLNKPIHPAMKKDQEVTLDSSLPKSGGIDLSYLEKEEQ